MSAAYTGEPTTGEGCLPGRRNRPSAPRLADGREGVVAIVVVSILTVLMVGLFGSPDEPPDLEGCCYIGGLLLRVRRVGLRCRSASC